jgi:dTDP-4-dehydrorhamnose 3,5-epimerase
LSKGVNFDLPMVGQIKDVHVWSMPSYSDDRGRLFKAYTATSFSNLPVTFETFEHFFTESKKNVFRGMHFQGDPHSVSKIISIVQGAAIDFLFDMRTHSETFGALQIVNLDEKEPVSIYIPTGVAHGYLALEEKTIISYRMNGPFCSNCDGGFSGDEVAKFLPIPFGKTIQSARDLALKPFQEFQYISKCDA